METLIWEDSLWIRTPDYLPKVVIFARDYNDKFKTKRIEIESFEPYFYAPFNASFFPREITHRDSPITDALGRKIVKCYTKLPSDVPQLKQCFDWTCEADVNYDFRFMVDNKISYAFVHNDDGSITPIDVLPLLPRIVYFDIEVRSPPTDFPEAKESKYPIASIQVMDSYTEDIKIFTNGVPQVASDQVACKNERDLLRQFLNYTQHIDPDILTGWYSNQYDIPYIVTRASHLKFSLNRLTRLPGSYSRPSAELRMPPAEPDESEKKKKNRIPEWSVRCPGRQLVDMKAAFEKFWKAEGELERKDLKSVVSNPDVMEDEVFKYDDYGARIDELYNNQDWDTFLQYCRNDVIALRAIDKKTKLFEFYEGLRHLTGVKAEETLKNSKMIESLLFRDPIMKPMPSRNYAATGTSYSGALVLDPVIGLHSDVGVFDLAALYPTIILAFNISPDIDHVIPRVIRTMMEERERLRALKMAGLADESTKKKETVVKFIVNSFYGVLGWPQFRLYNPTHAEFITTTGRKINQFLQDCSKDKGFEVIYGDSVSPTTPIIIRRNNSIHIIPIDYCRDGDETFISRWVKIKRVIKKPLRKQMYHVSIGRGNVVCTEDHSLLHNGVEISPSHLHIGDEVDTLQEFPKSNHNVIVNEDLAWIIGLFLAEGSRFNSRQYVINNQDIDLLDECIDRVEKVCGKRPLMSNYMQSSNCYRISYLPNEISIYLDDCYVENTWYVDSPNPYQTTGYKIVPSCILNSTIPVMRSFFEGYYAGDGSKVSHRAIDSKNECLALGLHYIAELIGKRVRCCVHKKSLSWGLRFPAGNFRKPQNVIKDIIQIPPEKLWFNHVVDLEIDDDSHIFASGKILLHNTDSIFVKGVTSEDLGYELQNYYNTRLEGWAIKNNALVNPTLKYEKNYGRAFFKAGKHGEATKKRYAGHLVWKDGKPQDKLSFTGLELKRSDQSKITKDTLRTFLERILFSNDIDGAIDCVRSASKSILSGSVNISDISIPYGIRNLDRNNPWSYGVKNSQEVFKIPFTPGEKPRLIYALGNYPYFCLYGDITEQDVVNHNIRIDWKTTHLKTLEGKMKTYIESLGRDWNASINGQTSMENWF